jgi:hypothetical protein
MSLNIAVAGMVAGDPGQGGASWAVLQYVLGLRRLGHRVSLVEAVRRSSIRPAGVDLEHSENASYFRRLIDEFELRGSAALVESGTNQTVGMSYAELRASLGRTDLLIDIAGILRDQPDLFEAPPIRLYLDLDPAFTQLWHAQGVDMRLDGHTHFATVGLTLEAPGSPIPSTGHQWSVTLPPVVLEGWPVADHVLTNAFTTVANWRSYGTIHHRGVAYGQKAHSWRQFMELPRRTGAPFVPALSIDADEHVDLDALERHGWCYLPAERTVATPADYRAFVSGSRAEIGIAKSGYVVSRSGWFSERSACYLAAGRPVVAQDTGFSACLPVGEGLLSFSTIDEAVSAVEMVERDYARHSATARSLAEAYFDSDRVLSSLLQTVGA